MDTISLLISPKAKSAFFAEYVEVAKAELRWMMQGQEASHQRIGEMDFLEIEAEPEQLDALARLSFVYGIFRKEDGHLIPLEVTPGFALHEDFVFGAKYKGKTNEMLTQLLINVGLQGLGPKKPSTVKLLDPMCGRGTTLLWAMRYGMVAKGIEQELKALGDIRQIVKKWSKIHRQKHQFQEGHIGAKNKQQPAGKFIEFSAENTSMKVIIGDSTEAEKLLKGEKFHLLVGDLPYGVQHFTTENTRNPLAVIKACAHGWTESLQAGGVLVLAFNRYTLKPKELIEAFAEYHMQPLEFSAHHRMSESIVRDIVVLKKES